MEIIEAAGLKARLPGGVGVQITTQRAGLAAFTRTPKDVGVISGRDSRLDNLRLVSALPVTFDASGINGSHIGDLLSTELGLWWTATQNLRRMQAARVSRRARGYEEPEDGLT
jgi:hypothetical protein